MASRMRSQSQATRRNNQVELLIDFTIQQFINRLYNEGYIAEISQTSRQIAFERDDCSDVFDHFFSLTFTNKADLHKGPMQFWAQTTCYKGNPGGAPESNKTYEIRETLIEALGLRRWLQEENVPARTLHFTVGPSNYTYAWFKDAKNNAFDISLYPSNSGITSIFDDLAIILGEFEFEFEAYERLSVEFQAKTTQVGHFIGNMSDDLYEWFKRGLPRKSMADQQAQLLTHVRISQSDELISALKASRAGGIDIKGRANSLLESGETDDEVMLRTLRRLTSQNPFLAVALQAESDWEVWCKDNFSIPLAITSLSEFLFFLWSNSTDARLVNRRLLLRIHGDEGTEYIQDVNVPGITEHNLYGGYHNSTQVEALVSQIETRCRNNGILTASDLQHRLMSHGKQIIRDSRRFESRNGTELKPSFYYVEEALSDDYKFVSFQEAALPEPLPYHASFSASGVNPYNNLKVVIRKDNNLPVAIIKAKFFRRQEFPRRAKEEAYVGLTTRYKLEKNQFVERYPGLPIIMFIDMEQNRTPPSYAIKRLVTTGWTVFFSLEELRNLLENVSRATS